MTRKLNLREVLVHPLVEVTMVYMVIVSLVIVVLDYTGQVREDLKGTLYAVDAVIVTLLLLDLIVRASLSGNPLRYIASNIYEIPALIPLYVFTLLEGVPSLAGLVRALRFLRLLRLILLLTRGSTMLAVIARTARRLQFSTIVGILALTVLTSAFTVYLVESSNGSSTIKTFWDALWWALATVTTVGYGDVIPETSAGRVVGAITMLVGIGVYSAFIGLIAATLTQALAEERRGVEDLKSMLEKLEELEREELEKLLEEIRARWEQAKARRSG